MKLIFFLLLISSSANYHPNNAKEVLRQMHERYAGKWMHSFTFNQTTENYRNDSLIKTATWYEALVYPDKFRIDFGNSGEGNAAIFTKDSVYSFRKGLLARVSGNDDDLTFLLGGMYFYPFDTVKAKMEKLGYSLNKYYDTLLDNKKVYVIGATNAGEKTNQIWVDADKLVLVKFIKYTDGQKEEGIFGNHKQFGNAWSETFCNFYIDDKLVQKESYHDCKANEVVDPVIFDPKNFVYRK